MWKPQIFVGDWNCVQRYENVTNSKHLFWKRIWTGNKFHLRLQPGGCRPLIYNIVISLYFLKMLFVEKPGKFSAFALLSLLKKSYRNIK